MLLLIFYLFCIFLLKMDNILSIMNKNLYLTFDIYDKAYSLRVSTMFMIEEAH